jgi:hypothetical protein
VTSAPTTSSSATTGTGSPSSTPGPSPTSLGPSSIVIVAKTKSASGTVLRVTAPTGTRFGVGKGVMDAIDCKATVVASGKPTAYRVVCPPAPTGSQLVATVPMGDFDVSFLKPL